MAAPVRVPTAPSSAALVTRLVTRWLAVMRLAGEEASKTWLGRSCKCRCQPACARMPYSQIVHFAAQLAAEVMQDDPVSVQALEERR